MSSRQSQFNSSNGEPRDLTHSRRTGPYRRNYRACDLCRRKKIRCDLGDLKDPQPPCAKCRREKRTCVFASKPGDQSESGRPRSRRIYGLSSLDPAEDDVGSPSHISREGVHIDSRIARPASRPPSRNAIPALPHKIINGTYDIHAASESPGSRSERQHDAVTQGIVDTVLRDDTDALHLLFDATLHQTPREEPRQANDDGPSLGVQLVGTSERLPTHESIASTGCTDERANQTQTATASQSNTSEKLPVLKADQLTLWARFPPCMQGVVSPAEVIAYLDYFFVVLNKQMPIVSNWFHDNAHHETLITEESILCYSILTISSRLFVLPGHNGQSRGYLLHDHFFRYVQEGLQSLLWGYILSSRSGISSVGAIESLMLLTQWQPRSLHLQLSLFDLSRSGVAFCESSARAHLSQDDFEKKAAATLALRTDTMCWRLINLAVTVAIENGLYDKHETKSHTSELCRGHDSRVPHIQQILYIYTSHLAGRLKRPSPLATVSLPNLKQEVDAAATRMSVQQSSEWQPVLKGWLDLVELGHVATQVFSIPSQLTTIAATESHPTVLVRHLSQSVSQWWKGFETLSMPKAFRYNMEVEYHYLKILIHAVALQSQLKRDSTSTSWHLGFQNQQGPELMALSREVAISCCRVYDVVVGLHELKALRAITAPLLLRIVTVSMFGLKVLLSTAFADTKLLSSLERAIVALQNCSVDDLHLARYYAQLLGHLVKRTKMRSGNGDEGNHGGTSSLLNGDAQPEHVDNEASLPHNEYLSFFDDTIPANWDDWLGFQFDPALANVFESGDNEHVLYAGQGRPDHGTLQFQ